jgi:hypothetical protein
VCVCGGPRAYVLCIYVSSQWSGVCEFQKFLSSQHGVRAHASSDGGGDCSGDRAMVRGEKGARRAGWRHVGVAALNLFGWLVADGWCWFVLREKYCWLVPDDWFILREKYCWLGTDKPNEQSGCACRAVPAHVPGEPPHKASKSHRPPNIVLNYPYS